MSLDAERAIRKLARLKTANEATRNEAVLGVEALRTTAYQNLDTQMTAVQGRLDALNRHAAADAAASGQRKKKKGLRGGGDLKALRKAELQAVEGELLEIIEMRGEFEQILNQILEEIFAADSSLPKLDFRTALADPSWRAKREAAMLKSRLPIYRYKRQILDTVRRKPVTLVMAETGAGKSTQLVQYLHQLFQDQLIVCCQPRKIAAVSLAQQVARELECGEPGGLVGYRVGADSRWSDETRILFVTDQVLVNDAIKDRDLSEYACLVLDEVHERSVNTDLLLGLAKDLLTRRPDFRVVVASATMESRIFHDYFGARKTAEVNVPGRTFPIEVFYSAREEEVSVVPKEYQTLALVKTEEILATTDQGDVLVFLPTPADTETLRNRLRAKNTAVLCLQLHGKLQVEEQQRVFATYDQRKVVFATNCAETSITVPGIVYVVDTGVAKEKQFDPVKNVSSLRIQAISQSSAKQRAGRAGRTQPGVCHRLFSQAAFERMRPSSVPEIKSMQLGQTLLRLLSLGISDPQSFDFIESPGQDNIQAAMRELATLDAVRLVTSAAQEQYQLTAVGSQMARLPIVPRLAKLLLAASQVGLGGDALILVAIASISGSVFFRGGSLDEVQAADQLKIQFCSEQGDFVTQVELYKTWSRKAEREKSKWCVANAINAKAMRVGREVLKDIKSALQKDVGIRVEERRHESSQADHLRLSQILFECFRDNLCVYSGHPRAGYICLRTREASRLHPSTSFLYLGNLSPQLVVYDQILKTSATFLISVSSVQLDWLSDAEQAAVAVLSDDLVSQAQIHPIGPRILKQSILGLRAGLLMQLDAEIRRALPPDSLLELECSVEDGQLIWWAARAHHEAIRSQIAPRLAEAKTQLAQESWRLLLSEATEDSPLLLLGRGGQLLDILADNDFNEIVLRAPGERREALILEVALEQLPGWCGKFQLRNQDHQVHQFRSAETAQAALNLLRAATAASAEIYHQQDVGPWRPMASRSSKQAAFELKVTIDRRREMDMAYIRFASEHEAAIVAGHFVGRLLIVEPSPGRTEMLRVQLNKREDKTSLFCWLRERNSSHRKEVTEEGLMQAFVKRGFKPVHVRIPKEKEFTSSQEEQGRLREDIGRIFTDSWTCTRADFSLDLKKAQPRDFSWVAWLRFKRSAAGLRCARFCEEFRPNISVQDGAGNTRLCPLNISYSLKTTFSCKTVVFDLVKEDINDAIEEVKELPEYENCGSLELQINNRKNPKEGADFVSFQLVCNDATMMATAKDALEVILRGDVLNHPNIGLILSPGNREDLKRIEREAGCILETNVRNGTLTIFGSESGANAVRREINSLLDKIIVAGQETTLISLKNYPSGFLKKLVNEYGPHLDTLLVMQGVHKATIRVQARTLHLVATREATNQVENMLQDLAANMTNITSEGEECPVCLSTPEKNDRQRLQYCGHLYCRTCLYQLILSSDIPFFCSAEGCKEQLVAEDLKDFDKEATLVRQLLDNSIDHAVSTGSLKLSRCPTPDCRGVFRKVEKGAAPVSCYICRAEICRSCAVPYHVGISCEFYQVYHSADNKSLREWMEEDPQNRKLCPTCKSPIEKNGGCNHVTCIKCKTHMCWFCLNIFTAATVYDHINRCSLRRY